MANKDHSLDKKIDSAAMKEFLENGYDKASMRKIAASAGATIGAIYTRYSTKDCLFLAMVQPLLDNIEEAFETLKEEYYKEAEKQDIKAIAKVMEEESFTILHLLFDDYDRAVLLLCKSRGSSLENFFGSIVQRKIQETLNFFRKNGTELIDPSVLKMLINAQFNMYFQIIDEGYKLEEAKKLMNSAIIYSTGGWLALFNSLGQNNGGLK